MAARSCLDDGVGFRKIFVVGAFALHQIRDGIEAEAVDAHIQPEAHDLQHGLQDLRIVEIQVRLMAEKAMPVISLRHRIPGPVRGLGVGEYDARAQVLLIRVAPHIKVALRRTGGRIPGLLKPGMLIRGVIDDQFGDHFESEPVRLMQQGAKIIQRAELRMHVLVIGNVVAVVLERRGVEGHQPKGVDTQVPDVFELRGQTLEIADAIVVGVEE